eukprot:ANDGO_00508.mRNA.1 4
MRLPVLFISHGGGPWPWMDFGARNGFAKLKEYLTDLPKQLPMNEVKSILIVSAHWEESAVTVSTSARPGMVYDYGGFPAHTYKIQYAAPGNPQIAARVRALLRDSEIACKEDAKRGFDHGVFVPLAVSFPAADIPVVMLSIHKSYDPKLHLQVGEALAPLRDEGVLIIGSGYSFHNLNFPPNSTVASKAFDEYLVDACCASSDSHVRHDKLVMWEKAPGARIAHPQEDHLVPLFVVAGAALQDPGVRVFNDCSQIMQGLPAIQVSGFQFG